MQLNDGFIGVIGKLSEPWVKYFHVDGVEVWCHYVNVIFINNGNRNYLCNCRIDWQKLISTFNHFYYTIQIYKEYETKIIVKEFL